MTVEAHRRAERIFAISAFTRRELVELLGVEEQRIALCPLGVDPSFRAVTRPPRDGVRNLLFFGRIIYWKGFLDAIEALGHVARAGQRDWTYRLVGFGHKQRALDAAREQGIGEQVAVLDPVDDAGLREHLAWADLAVMPSYFESFGLSIAEAQAAGLPVVAYAAGSVPEIVADGETGWLAPARDVRALAEAIAAALADPAETARRGARARERAARFDWQSTARIVYGGLAELAAGSAAPASASV
jgi:glycogen(starch) synthase